MIPTKATDEQFETYVSNIVATWHRASAEQVSKGRGWYPVANDLASMIGHGNVRLGAGVIAALSANKRWHENMRLAIDAGNGHVHGHVGNALGKVRAILAGTDPAMVLPMALKTGNFFANIADPANSLAVTIDRHAHDIAVGETYGNRDRGLSNPNRYAMLRDAYRMAGQRLGELASTVQAVTWTYQVEMLAGTSSRGQRQS